MNKNEEKAVVRETMYADILAMDTLNFAPIGRVAEGLVYKTSKGEYIVVKAIVKNPDFDGEFEVEAYAEDRAKKKAEADAKAKAKEVKIAKAKAKQKEA